MTFQHVAGAAYRALTARKDGPSLYEVCDPLLLHQRGGDPHISKFYRTALGNPALRPVLLAVGLALPSAVANGAAHTSANSGQFKTPSGVGVYYCGIFERPGEGRQHNRQNQQYGKWQRTEVSGKTAEHWSTPAEAEGRRRISPPSLIVGLSERNQEP